MAPETGAQRAAARAPAIEANARETDARILSLRSRNVTYNLLSGSEIKRRPRKNLYASRENIGLFSFLPDGKIRIIYAKIMIIRT